MPGKRVRTNSAPAKRTGRPRWPWFAAPILLAAAAVAVFKLAPRAPAGRVAALWSERGVAKPNVLLITLDTTRADHLACYGYPGVATPNLDAIAGRGVLFEQAATATPLTLPAHTTIMTGMLPTYHGVRVNGNTALGDDQTTLAEVLAGRGYETGAFIAAFVLDGRWGLKQGFAHYDDRFDLKKYKHLDLGEVQRPGNEVVDAALAWLEAEKSKPFFAWVHLYDPHVPYAPPEPYASIYARRGPAGPYDGEIAFMDEQVGRLTGWLAKNGLDSSSATMGRAWGATARARTATSCTIMRCTCRSSWPLPSTPSRASACLRRSARPTFSRPSSTSSGPPRPSRPRAVRSRACCSIRRAVTMSRLTAKPWPRTSSSAGAPCTPSGRRATSISTRRGRSSTISPGTPGSWTMSSPHPPTWPRG
ncbi:MAG: sulfatase [Candidatus Aminicenantes bacterium]|nr:sulfatase [Candidatus Aminicenantes bacterium]